MEITEITDLIFRAGALASCKSTIGGWIWYCDEHDTHGNADSREEAEQISKAHFKYQLKAGKFPKKYADECCDIIIEKVRK